MGLIARGLPESPRTSMSGQTAADSVAITTLLNPFGDTGKIEDPARYLVRQPLTREVFDESAQGRQCLHRRRITDGQIVAVVLYPIRWSNAPQSSGE